MAETDAVVEGIDNGCIFFGAFGALVGTGAGAMLATVGVILRLACEWTGGSWDEAPYSTYWKRNQCHGQIWKKLRSLDGIKVLNSLQFERLKDFIFKVVVKF